MMPPVLFGSRPGLACTWLLHEPDDEDDDECDEKAEANLDGSAIFIPEVGAVLPKGGIAGVYAIMRKLSGVMVGVAIATALVPPLSTVGFGLATGRFDFALGAALLFLTNTLAIAFAATMAAQEAKNV